MTAEFIEEDDNIYGMPLQDWNFEYSRRPGTPAADMPHQVPPPVKRDRTNQLIDLSEQKKNIFYRQHIGERRPVLLEAEEKGDMMFGFTDNYIKIQIPYREEFINTIKVIEIQEDNLSITHNLV